MKRLLLILSLMLPLAAQAQYYDHRSPKLDSLEVVVSRYTPDVLAAASDEQLDDYAHTCRQLTWAYLQLDGARCKYYGRRAIAAAEKLGDLDTRFDVSILMGQCFWAGEQYDSARVYYNMAAEALAANTALDDVARESGESRLWGTLGNFYATQDSLELFAYYYGKAGAIFEKNGWLEDASLLHYNIGEVYTDEGDLRHARPEYERALELARKTGDSLIIARSLSGLGRWHQASGHTGKALRYLTQADEYFGEHQREEAYNRAETLAIMNDARKDLYLNVVIISAAVALILLLVVAALLIMHRLKRTQKELTETSAVLDETIEELRPTGEARDSDIHLTKREKDVARLLMEGKTTQEIAWELGIGDETVLWYRKRLYAKLNVHSAAAFATEMHRRGMAG